MSVINKYTNKFRKNLLEKISGLSTTEHEEVFKIIKNNDIQFTQNKNGIFFNMSVLSDDVISEIDIFVTFCFKNSKELDEYDKKLNECKLSQTINTMIPHSQTTETFVENNHSFKIKDNNEWSFLTSIDEKKMKNITNFIDKMNTDHEKIGKKNVNVKFYNAQKKYMKKHISEKKICDYSEVFEKEEYKI